MNKRQDNWLVWSLSCQDDGLRSKPIAAAGLVDGSGAQLLGKPVSVTGDSGRGASESPRVSKAIAVY